MKKLMIFVSTAALLFCSFAQASAQVQFAAKAGLNLARVVGDDDEDVKMLPTFLIGGRAEFGLNENLGLGVGLEVSGKGFKVEEMGVTGSLKPIYLQVPVQLFYHNNGFFAGFGPYIGFGIAGKAKIEDISVDLDFGNSSEDDVAPIDFGAGVELGYQFGAVRATASYNLGLSNIVPSDNADNFSLKNHVIGIAVAYLFGNRAD